MLLVPAINPANAVAPTCVPTAGQGLRLPGVALPYVFSNTIQQVFPFTLNTRPFYLKGFRLPKSTSVTRHKGLPLCQSTNVTRQKGNPLCQSTSVTRQKGNPFTRSTSVLSFKWLHFNPVLTKKSLVTLISSPKPKKL